MPITGRAGSVAEPDSIGPYGIRTARSIVLEALGTAPGSALSLAVEVLGENGCDRIRTLARPFSRAAIDAGLLTPDLSRYRDGA